MGWQRSSCGELGDGAAANEQRRRLEWLGMGSDCFGLMDLMLAFGDFDRDKPMHLFVNCKL
jgi:hypothetical protein